jgi:ABC-type Fe3+-hydroxamate transport system substrate-binding protein
MSNFLRLIGGSFVLSIATVSFVNAQETQTTTTKTTTVTESRQNPDGSYTVVEYPVGKEVVVDLTPSATLPGAKELRA